MIRSLIVAAGLVSCAISTPTYASLPACSASFTESLCQSQFKELKRLARNGSPEAAVLIGFLYSKGEHGLEKDDEKAVKFFKKAAKKRSAIGQTELAKMYLLGAGVERDTEKAMTYLKMAAKQNYGDARALIAALQLESKTSTQAEKAAAVEELETLAETNKTEANYFLGKYYLLSEQKDKALQYLTLSSKSGHPVARGLIETHFEENNDDFYPRDNNGEYIERITVTSYFTFKDALATIIDYAQIKYDDQTTGSRIQGRSCVEDLTCKAYSGKVNFERGFTSMRFISNNAEYKAMRKRIGQL